PPTLARDVTNAFEEQINSVLRPHHAQINNQVRAALFELGTRRTKADSLRLRRPKQNKGPLGRNASALDGDRAVRFVRCEHGIGRPETRTLEKAKNPVDQIAPAELDEV